MDCLLEALLCFDHWYNVNFNCNLCKFSDKFLCTFSMRSFVLWVDTIFLNWIKWILLFPILSDSIFVIFITHRLVALLTLPTPVLQDNWDIANLNQFCGSSDMMCWSLSLYHGIPTLYWYLTDTFGRNYTSAWPYPTKVHLNNFACMRHWLYTAMEQCSWPGQHWNNMIYDSEQTIHLSE